MQAPVDPGETWGWDSLLNISKLTKGHKPDDVDKKDSYDDNVFRRKASLLHATLHLPPPTTLNALFLRRLSPTMQLSMAICSSRDSPLSKSAPQASLLTQLSHDTGKYSNEYLFSTDSTLFGWRGLWNFGPDPRRLKPGSAAPLSLLSAGAEAYYSPVSSLVGMSTGLRFSTLPAATEGSSSPTTQSQTQAQSLAQTAAPISTFPYTLTLTLTPLTGSVSTTYSLSASPNISFSSRFGFNVYSWESEMVAGCELWRPSKPAQPEDDGLEWARRKMRMTEPLSLTAGSVPPPESEPEPKSAPAADSEEETSQSVLKIRVDQSWNVRLLWEGRVKELLVSAGVGLGPSSFSSSNPPPGGAQAATVGPGGGPSYWRGVGVSIGYSS